MSTKIYNGYKIKSQSLDDAIEKIFHHKEKIKNLIKNQICYDLLSIALENYYDFYLQEIFQETKNKDLSSSSIGLIMENDNQEDKINLSICLFPKKENIKNESYYLMMLYLDKYEKIIEENNILKDLNITEYAYWDNTDQLENITRKEWEKRKDDWNKALGDDGIPSNNSVIIELLRINQKELIFYKRKDEIIDLLKDAYEKMQKNWSKKSEILKRICLEKINYKVALKAIMIEKNIQNIESFDSKYIFIEQKKYIRGNKFIPEEKMTIENAYQQICKIIDNGFKLDNLLETQSEIIEKYKILQSTKKESKYIKV